MKDVPIIKTPLRLQDGRTIVDAEGQSVSERSLNSRPGQLAELVRRANAYKELPSVEDLRNLAGHYHDGHYRSSEIVHLLEKTIKAILEAEASPCYSVSNPA